MNLKRILLQSALIASLGVFFLAQPINHAQAVGGAPSELEYPEILADTSYTKVLTVSTYSEQELRSIQISVVGDDASQVSLSQKTIPVTQEVPKNIPIKVTVRASESKPAGTAVIHITPVFVKKQILKNGAYANPVVKIPLRWNIVPDARRKAELVDVNIQTVSSTSPWKISGFIKNSGNTSFKVSSVSFLVEGKEYKSALPSFLEILPFETKAFQATVSPQVRGSQMVTVRILDEAKKILTTKDEFVTVPGNFSEFRPIPWWKNLKITVPLLLLSSVILIFNLFGKLKSANSRRLPSSRKIVK